MRLQSDITVTVRRTTIGGAAPLICIPLVAAEHAELRRQAADLVPLAPDLFEWRVDGFGDIGDGAACLAALADLRHMIGEIPLIVTCRIDTEGGLQPISRETRLARIDGAIRSGLADLVDVELCNDPAFVDTVRDAAGRHGVKLILSHHDFLATPDKAVMVDTLRQAQARGADIAKLAVMPGSYGDVLTLLAATYTARTEAVSIPLITIAMGADGAVSRLAGGLFGADITFAIGKTASAPGQIPIDALRRAMAVLYP